MQLNRALLKKALEVRSWLLEHYLITDEHSDNLPSIAGWYARNPKPRTGWNAMMMSWARGPMSHSLEFVHNQPAEAARTGRAMMKDTLVAGVGAQEKGQQTFRVGFTRDSPHAPYVMGGTDDMISRDPRVMMVKARIDDDIAYAALDAVNMALLEVVGNVKRGFVNYRTVTRSRASGRGRR